MEMRLSQELNSKDATRRRCEMDNRASLAKLQRAVLREQTAQRARMEALQAEEELLRTQLNRARANSAANEAAEQEAARASQQLEEATVRQRGLREDARGPAVLTADAAGAPILPQRVWEPRSTPSAAAASSAVAAAAAATASAAAAAAPSAETGKTDDML